MRKPKSAAFPEICRVLGVDVITYDAPMQKDIAFAVKDIKQSRARFQQYFSHIFNDVHI